MFKWFQLPLILGFSIWLGFAGSDSKPSFWSPSALFGEGVAIALLALLTIRAWRMRVIVTESGMVVVNLFRSYGITISELRRVSWTRYKATLGAVLPWHPVITLSIQSEQGVRATSIRVLCSLAGPYRGSLTNYLERVCLANDIPCDLSLGSW